MLTTITITIVGRIIISISPKDGRLSDISYVLILLATLVALHFTPVSKGSIKKKNVYKAVRKK